MSIFRPENPELILHFPERCRLFLSKVILLPCIAGPAAGAFFANPVAKQILEELQVFLQMALKSSGFPKGIAGIRLKPLLFLRKICVFYS